MFIRSDSVLSELDKIHFEDDLHPLEGDGNDDSWTMFDLEMDEPS